MTVDEMKKAAQELAEQGTASTGLHVIVLVTDHKTFAYSYTGMSKFGVLARVTDLLQDVVKSLTAVIT